MLSSILIPVDGSPLSETILDWVRQVGGGNIDVHLLQVLPPRALTATAAFGGIEAAPPERQEEARGRAEAYLRRLGGALGVGVRVHTLVRIGEPAAEIVRAARDAGADVIAMSTHGRTGMARLMVGSVAEEVVRTAHRPVLLLRPDDEALARHEHRS